MRFKIDRTSHIVGRKFTVFALFCFVFGRNFQVSRSPQGWGGAHIRRGNLTEGCLRYEFGGLYMEGLIFGILRYVPPPPAKRASSKVHNISHLLV